MSFIEIYTVVVVHLAAIPAIVYPLIYRNVPWKKGPTGKALMNKARSVALLFTVSILGFWWPFPGYEYIYAGVTTYLGFAIAYQLRVMYRLRKRGFFNHPSHGNDLPPTHTTRGNR